MITETQLATYYADKTVLDGDFLRNNYQIVISDVGQLTAVQRFYYQAIVSFISQENYLKPTADDIEYYLTHGYFENDYEDDIYGNESIDAYGVCKVTDAVERTYLFLQAQALQYKYDKSEGRANMLRGETNNMCPDTLEKLRQLGLIKHYAI